jgi:hypothetical protein
MIDNKNKVKDNRVLQKFNPYPANVEYRVSS